jgi:hypothetical protein
MGSSGVYQISADNRGLAVVAALRMVIKRQAGVGHGQV